MLTFSKSNQTDRKKRKQPVCGSLLFAATLFQTKSTIKNTTGKEKYVVRKDKTEKIKDKSVSVSTLVAT